MSDQHCINHPDYSAFSSDSFLQTDEAAIAALRTIATGIEGQEGIIATQIELFKLYRVQQFSIAQSYERALLAYLNACRNQRGEEEMEPVL